MTGTRRHAFMAKEVGRFWEERAGSVYSRSGRQSFNPSPSPGGLRFEGTTSTVLGTAAEAIYQ